MESLIVFLNNPISITYLSILELQFVCKNDMDATSDHLWSDSRPVRIWL